MAKIDYDGVVEAVHFDDQGQIKWVRAYLRRGFVWSDHVMIDRDDLVDKIDSGLRFRTGERLQYEGGTFETSHAVELVQVNKHKILVAGDGQAKTDSLPGVPQI